jgi:hypothetical protein
VARRARHDLPAVQEKRAQVVALRAEGRTWDQIAADVGYSNGSAASKAWRAAIRARPDLSVDEIRRAERERLEQMDSRLSVIISSPPIKTTSIGRTQWDPRTCTCGVRGDTKREHAADCPVEPVLDANSVIAAIKERRMVGESLRRLTGADEAPRGIILDDRALRVMTEVAAARNQLEQQSPGIPRPSLPADYHALSPEQQLHAVLDRERAHRDAMLAAISAAPPGDDDVVDAEIVDE